MLVQLGTLIPHSLRSKRFRASSREESWEESKKRNDGGGGGERRQAFSREFVEKVGKRAKKGMTGKGEGKEGTACPQTPRF